MCALFLHTDITERSKMEQETKTKKELRAERRAARKKEKEEKKKKKLPLRRTLDNNFFALRQVWQTSKL